MKWMTPNNLSPDGNMLLTSLLDLISPRACLICGRRLSPSEESLCAACNFDLPRTGYHLHPTDNLMAKLFWGQTDVRRATALFFYSSKADSSRLIYALKYGDQPDTGATLGRMLAAEVSESGFFDGISAIIPVPLAPRRRRQRGYNQSEKIAQGVAEVSGIEMLTDVLRREQFDRSQTHLSRWERQENVDDVFRAVNPERLADRHVLLIDDVVTTGATLLACAHALEAAPAVRFSFLTLGFTRS